MGVSFRSPCVMIRCGCAITTPPHATTTMAHPRGQDHHDVTCGGRAGRLGRARMGWRGVRVCGSDEVRGLPHSRTRERLQSLRHHPYQVIRHGCPSHVVGAAWLRHPCRTRRRRARNTNHGSAHRARHHQSRRGQARAGSFGVWTTLPAPSGSLVHKLTYTQLPEASDTP